MHQANAVQVQYRSCVFTLLVTVCGPLHVCMFLCLSQAATALQGRNLQQILDAVHQVSAEQ